MSGKWISAGISMAGAYFGIRFLVLKEGLGINIVENSVAHIAFTITIVGFVLAFTAIPEKYKGTANLIASIALLGLLLIGMSCCATSCKENKKVKGNTLMEEVEKEKERILANLITKQAAKELGLSQKKSYQTKKSYFRRTTTSQKKVVKTPPPISNWGGSIGISTCPGVVNSWSKFAQTEARKAMSRCQKFIPPTNQGNQVKIK